MRYETGLPPKGCQIRTHKIKEVNEDDSEKHR